MILRKLLAISIAVTLLAMVTPTVAQEIVTVGSTPTGIPFTFLDTKTNTIQGVMVDLITEIGKDAGFDAKIEPMAFSALIPALTSKKIDLIAAAMYVTAKRQEVISFSEPVYTYGEGLIVPASDTKDYKEFADLKGETVGVQVGTAYVEPLQKTGLFTEVKIYETIQDILSDVNSGRLKAGFADYPIVAYHLQQGLFPKVRLVKSMKSTMTGSVGIGVNKSNEELLKRVNVSLTKLQANGKVDEILKKWGLN